MLDVPWLGLARSRHRDRRLRRLAVYAFTEFDMRPPSHFVILTLIVLALSTSTVLAQSDSDLTFDEVSNSIADSKDQDGHSNNIDPLSSPLLSLPEKRMPKPRSAAFTDDEDFYEGSSDVTPSGDGALPEETFPDFVTPEPRHRPPSHTETPVSPLTPAPPLSDDVVYFRMTLTIVNIPYNPMLSDRSSMKFQRMSEELMVALESLYQSVPGQQAITVLSYTPITLQNGREGILVNFDCGSRGFNDEQRIESVIKDAILRGYVGNFHLSEEGFSFKPFGVPPRRPVTAAPTRCAPNQIACPTGECVGHDKRCDGHNDCSDGYDEHGCRPSVQCPSGHFVCDGHRCVDERRRCDGRPDCADQTDESNCVPTQCKDDEFRCRTGECIKFFQRCDHHNDCPNAEDEQFCQDMFCSPEEFQCFDKTCIDNFRRCDGVFDCSDRSDESNCTGVVCPPGQFRCDSGSCVDMIKRCDGQRDCPDGADERGCPCSSSQWQCDLGQCIDRRMRCNGHIDCPGDNSDERECPTTPTSVSCRIDQYRCSDGACIPLEGRCNGRRECRDGSDERNCPCRSDQFMCENGFCIDARRKCDGYNDCQDKSDEKNCIDKCEENEFRCDDGSCVPASARCDRRHHCKDGSDERNCRPSACRFDQFRCTDGTCLNIAQRCDGTSDCPGGEDEASCGTCPQNQFRCKDGTCITYTLRCDGEHDCLDGSDESDCESPPTRCRPTDFVCGDGMCLNQTLKCNRRYDCRDGTDELICRQCQHDEFVCNKGTCIDSKKRCDGSIDCPSGEDEADCPPSCRPSEFRCGDGSCIPLEDHCDGQVDCPDGADERDCASVLCTSREFRCRDGTCIDKRRQCDGRRDCSDSSDEQDCAFCQPNLFRCSNGICIDIRRRCNGIRECTDNSDEENCECKQDEFQCADGGCIDARRRCDARPDCSDQSDELNCVSGCKAGEFKCTDGRCIDERRRCDGRPDCSDNSDEAQCGVKECGVDQFRCRNGECIALSNRCDRKYDCRDGTDEFDCVCQPGQFRCREGTCIDARKKCDNVTDCADGHDEEQCVCPPGHFRCSNGQCIQLSLRCDRKYDCSDGSDEFNCVTVCEQGQFKCQDGTCIDSRRKCDNHTDCSDGSDEEGCACAPGQFRCTNGRCIEAALKCDRKYDCSDGSDEFNCVCSPTQFQCKSGECIDLAMRCNGQSECRDSSDEQDCGSCQPGQYICANGQCIDRSQRCNGKFECSDYSDEADCEPHASVNVKVYPERETIRQGREVVFRCRDEGTRRSPVKWSRADNRAMPPGTTDVRGRLTMPNIQLEHSGVYICSAVGVPSGTSGAQKAAFLTVQPYIPPTPPEPTRPPGFCGQNQATCQNGDCISRDYVCDGDYDCSDGSDELTCVYHARCQPNEFQCENQKCILKVWRCDGENDCGDNSDEKGCDPPSPGSPCQYHEFTCRSGNQCIPKSMQCDNDFDCQDKSDEIGCSSPTITRPPPDTIVVTEGETVTITCVAIGNPTPLISWRLNWGHIPQPPRVTVESENGHGIVTIRDSRPSDQGAWSCEAINSMDSILAIPDAILVVKTKAGICTPPLFNDDARNPSECLRCHCFGITDTCYSSNMIVSRIALGPKMEIAAMTRQADGSYSDLEDRYPPDQTTVMYSAPDREFRIDNQVRQRTAPNTYFYWRLPAEFLGNQLNSYGGYLRYFFRYSASYIPKPPRIADIILKGNGLTLYHVLKQPYGPQRENNVTVRFWEGEWHKNEAQGRGDIPVVDITTREDIMMLLANIEAIYVRASFDEEIIETSVGKLEMDTAIMDPNSSAPRAVFVEKCSCPEGYTGNSCEQCANGYRRQQQVGGYLGRCVPISVPCNCHGHSNICDPTTGQCLNCQHNTEGRQCEQCKRGFYGEPRRGTSGDCQPCPCPLITPPNQFSTTCHIDSEGEVACDACPIGYDGKRCERCAPGYEGNPTVLGETCKLKGVCESNQFRCSDGACIDIRKRCDGRADCSDFSDETGCEITKCDPIGSLSSEPSSITGLCPCKPSVTGAQCDQCKPNSFYLNQESPSGCIDCFCMGTTKSCTSSTWFRDTETLQFITSSTSGVMLTNLQRTITIDRNLRVNSRARELEFRDFSPPPRQTYYWQLPSRFLGDKVTMYGGRLNYTVKFESGTAFASNIDPDVEIIGNGIFLIYRHPERLRSGSPQHVSIPMFETSWLRPDGQPANREHLLMALADLSAILIKATYTSDTTFVSLIEVSADIAVDRQTSQVQAYAVEQCRCPIGYQGLSCEDCVPGYTRSKRGLYLGLCEPCFCNGHSSDCDPETGFCKNCQHNTVGDDCERCAPGFIGDPTGGSPHDCQPAVEPPCQCDARGSVNLDCDFRDNCPCKPNVQGKNCNRCKEGFFHLEERNSEGCSSCFCFGVTQQCSSSSYYRDQIRMRLLQDLPNLFTHNFQLTNRYRLRTFTEDIIINPSQNEVSFTSFPREAEQTETLFWSLPEQFLGNKLSSYGGKLRYTQIYQSGDEGDFYSDADVEMTGNGISVYYVNAHPLNPQEMKTFEIPLRETSWQHVDSRGPTTATREDFMKVLANVEALLIRASFHPHMLHTAIRDVVMDTAVPQATGQALAVEVEQCVCPPGYVGLSCEECAQGYIRDANGPGLGRCTRCNCNGHSESCDANTGRCVRCRHNTVGDSCERCADGFYGDATRGTPEDCKPCPCPLTLQSNQFSPTCILDSDGQPTCTACRSGYVGRNCEQCSAGYKGNPLQPGGSCEPHEGGGIIFRVRIEEPKVQRVVPGATVTFHCVGVSQVSDVTYNLVWTKQGGSLPARAIEASGVLTISDVRTEDSGTYVCTGYVPTNVVSQDSVNLIVEEYTNQPSAPKVRIEPRFQEVTVGQPVEFRCIVEGFPLPEIRWTGGRNNQINPEATITEDGIFRIPAAKKSDEAEYYCTATNAVGTENVRTILFVKGEDTSTGERPQITVTPASYEAYRGETVRFDCRVTGTPAPTIIWSFAGGSLPEGSNQVGGVLTLTRVTESHQGMYICTATNSHGTTQSQARLVLQGGRTPPTARIEPERQTLIQGGSGELRCIVGGTPTPLITWSKVGGELGPRHKVDGEKLIIEDVVTEDRGLYVCKAENKEGSAQASSIVEVERREVPAIELYPDSTQVIIRGGSALFQCRVTAGIPSPTVEWTRADGSPFTASTEILNGGVIRFNRVTGDEEGTYVCTAENIAGKVTAQASLRIEGAPTARILQPSPYHVRVGEYVKLECVGEGNPKPNVVWRRLSQYAYTPIVQPEDREVGDSVFEIHKVTHADSGTYICVARNSAGEAQERIQLIVEDTKTGVPEVVVDETVLTAAEGGKAVLRCHVRGTNRNVQLMWERSDGRGLPANHRTENGILYLDDIKKEDEGEYSCLGIIEGDIVLFTAKTRIAVVAPPRIQLNPSRQTARPGDIVFIQCTATGDQPITFDWMKRGSVLPPNVVQNSGLLEFRGITLNDQGHYLCTAVNAAGRAQGIAEVLISEEPDLGVPRKEETAFVGSNIELKCPVTGSPPPVSQWTKDGAPFPDNARVINNELWIRNVRLDNAGRYICTATSSAGTSRDFIILNVRENNRQCSPHEFQCSDGTCIDSRRYCDQHPDCPDHSDEQNCAIPTLVVKIVPSKDVVQMGDSLILHCRVTGDPSAPIYWSRPGQEGPFPENVRVQGSVLSINGVKSENGGVYRCSVESYAGVFNDDYVLAIQVTPTFSPDEVETRTVPFGSTVVMNCDTTLEKPVAYTWTKQGDVLPQNAYEKDGTLTIPDVRAKDAGTYVCTARNNVATIDIPTVVVVTGVVPYFAQAPLSYMSMQTLPDAYLKFDVELSFKPENLNGLLVYNGQREIPGDFISLGLVDGYVEFKYELGSGQARIRSAQPVEISTWHTVHFRRDNRDGFLKVDDQPEVTGSVPGKFVGLDLNEPLYIGGVPDISLISKQSGFDRGFVGCISRFKIGNTIHELVRDAEAFSVTTCEMCAENPCLHDGVCQEALTTTGYKCICPPGFSGDSCEKIGEACYAGVCGEGRCVNKPMGGFDCYCPFGKTGLRCEKEVVIVEPAFGDDAFVAYPTPRDAQRTLKVNMRVKPSTLDDGIIMYCAQSPDGQGDFASLALHNQSLEFRFDMGSGLAIIRSPDRLQADEWIDVLAEREMQEGSLIVNNGVAAKGRSPGHARGLNLLLPLYIGGFDRQKVKVSPSVDVNQGFDGCIARVEVNSVNVDLVNAVIDSSNVGDCGSHTSCERSPCQNGGICRETGNGRADYECLCPDGFSGRNCENEKDLCDLIQPCKNGATCVGVRDTYKCNCPLGYAGPHCEKASSFNEAAYFQGESYLSLDREMFPHTSSATLEVIRMSFSTSEDNGILFYHGQTPETDGRAQDYLAVALADGRLEFSYELGSGSVQITSPIRVSDGKRHTVILKRTGKNGSLEIDGQYRQYGESQGTLQMLNTAGDIYIGGVPDHKLMTADRYPQGFVGCIWDLEIQDSGVVNLFRSAKTGTNVLPCEDVESGEHYLEELNEDNFIQK